MQTVDMSNSIIIDSNLKSINFTGANLFLVIYQM